MTVQNFAHDIAAAEAAGNTALLAAIARELLAKQPKTKATKTKAPADSALLTLSERLALGLAPEKKPRFKNSAAYRHVLVTFADGYRQLAGYYPRLPDPDDMTPAIASARGRLLTLLSGGRFNDPAKAKDLPAIVSARIVTDPEELERERFWCMALREQRELATPGFCPFPEGPAREDFLEKLRLEALAVKTGLSPRFF